MSEVYAWWGNIDCKSLETMSQLIHSTSLRANRAQQSLSACLHQTLVHHSTLETGCAQRCRQEFLVWTHRAAHNFACHIYTWSCTVWPAFSRVMWKVDVYEFGNSRLETYWQTCLASTNWVKLKTCLLLCPCYCHPFLIKRYKTLSCFQSF